MRNWRKRLLALVSALPLAKCGLCAGTVAHLGAKEVVAWADVAARVPELLEIIQADMFAAAKGRTANCTEECHNWEQFMTALNNKHMALTPWCVGRMGCCVGHEAPGVLLNM